MIFEDFERFLGEFEGFGWKGIILREVVEGVLRYVFLERVEENDWYIEVFFMELGGFGWRV